MMDEEYIKMCREAVEIQKAWKPKSGDCVGCKGKTEIIYDYIPQVGVGDNYAEDMIEFGMWGDGDYWLPRQEDLQEIYMEQIKCSQGTALFDFLQWFYLHYENEKRILDSFSITTMWLCFVMETCYSKRWNADKETWEMIG